MRISQFLCSLARIHLANPSVRNVSTPTGRFLCSTAPIRQDNSAAPFCHCNFLWRSDEGVLLYCFNAQPDIFAVRNFCVVAL